MKSSSQEKITLTRVAELDNLELMQAHYVTQTFPRHTHEGFGVGVIEHGALGFYYRGQNVVATQGNINLVNPDEVHTGQAETDYGWRYRMFYFSADTLQQAASEIIDKPAAIPFFQKGIIDDPELAASLYALHQSLTESHIPLLEKETRFLSTLIQLVTRHADHPPQHNQIQSASSNIAKAKEYILDRYNQELSINELCRIANMSKFHFIRSFKKQMGLTPHAYLLQARAIKAKELLKKGHSITDAAYITGFSDQSHLTRSFKRLFGYTPGKYSNFIQDQ